MTQYLLSVYQPDTDEPPEPEVMHKIMKDVEQVNLDLRAAGAWVFAAGLEAPATATVVRAQNGEVVTTDGPFIESHEYLGGFSIIEVADLDQALSWGRRLADATTLPIEIRSFHGEPKPGT